MIHEQSTPLKICCLAVLLITPQVLGRALVDPETATQSRCADCAGSSGPDAARRGQPLWPGARFTEEDRTRAICRGLNFIYRSSRNPRNFARRGQDYLWCFDTTAKAFKDSTARCVAQCMGVERANEWRRLHRSIPPGASADTVAILVFGSKAAAGLGVSDGAMKEELRSAAARFSARDFLDFDPAIEPPPVDVPEDCVRCGSYNLRGSRFCSVCKAGLKMRSRYDVWSGALIATWDGDHYGVKLGASYADVLKWLPAMRPYRGREEGRNSEFEDIVYAVTHVVYTLNDYSVYRLSPALLPQEFEFLKTSLKEAIAIKNPDMLGEFMDTLRSFGLTEYDPLIQTGMEYLLSHQNRDGSWGDKRLRYHAAWTAIDGLSEYAWRGEGLSFPELKPLLERWAGLAPQ